jgi:sporulation protein YlmC with PRC-barrel domain
MTAHWNGALVAAFASLVAIEAHAQDSQRAVEATRDRVARTTQFVGSTVVGVEGEKVGDLKDLVIDDDSDCVAFAVVTTKNDKLLAIPFATLQRSAKEGGTAFTLASGNVDMAKAPHFDAKSWPEFDHAYAARIYDFYKAKPYWKDAATSEARIADGDAVKAAETAVTGNSASSACHTCRVTALIGQNVVDGHDKKIAELFDVVVDEASGRVAYAILATGGFFGVGEQLMAVPWASLKAPATAGKAHVLDVSKERLELAPAFDKKSWPDLADRQWGAGIHRFWEQRPFWDVRAEPHSDAQADAASDVARHE